MSAWIWAAIVVTAMPVIAVAMGKWLRYVSRQLPTDDDNA